jgi:hypothetical protein
MENNQLTVKLRKLNLAKMHENQAVQIVMVSDAITGKYISMFFEPIRIQRFKMEI